MKRRKSIINYIIIVLVLIFIGIYVFILLDEKLFNKNNNTKDIFKLPFVEKEYDNIIGYNFFTKEDGTVLVKSYVSNEKVNVPTDGTVINVKEKVVKIEEYAGEENVVAANVLLLTENGNLYNLDLGQDILDNSNLYKYSSNQKIKDIKLVKIENVWNGIAAAVELENGETRLVGSRNILISPSECSIGKKVSTLTINGDYIVIENDNRIRIGNINKDKYYSIINEKWINENAEIANNTYIKNDNNVDLKVKDFSFLNQGDITSIYIITNENKLIYLSVSDKSLLEENKVLEKYEIKLNKVVSEFISNDLNTVQIKFTDGTSANIKDNNLIFGMLSENNNFFTFSKQNIKNNIEYKILTNKLGVNYKIKEYETINSTINNNTYVINIFIITEDNKMIMTRVSNSKLEDYIDIMKVEELSSEKLIEKFEKIYSENGRYTVNVIFKDGSKVDLKTFAKNYLSLG
jgi:hypothetical protein